MKRRESSLSSNVTGPRFFKTSAPAIRCQMTSIEAAGATKTFTSPHSHKQKYSSWPMSKTLVGLFMLPQSMTSTVVVLHHRCWWRATPLPPTSRRGLCGKRRRQRSPMLNRWTRPRHWRISVLSQLLDWRREPTRERAKNDSMFYSRRRRPLFVFICDWNLRIAQTDC